MYINHESTGNTKARQFGLAPIRYTYMFMRNLSSIKPYNIKWASQKNKEDCKHIPVSRQTEYRAKLYKIPIHNLKSNNWIKTKLLT